MNKSLIFTKGDLLKLAEEGQFNVIVHGCNCFKTMGSGIAKQIREKYPSAYEADLSYSIRGDYNKLGNYSIMRGKKFDIINAYTQYDFGRGSDVFEYEAFALILKKLAHVYSKCNFGFPLIGCGLAGGNKDIILSILDNFASKLEFPGSATVVEYKA